MLPRWDSSCLVGGKSFAVSSNISEVLSLRRGGWATSLSLENVPEPAATGIHSDVSVPCFRVPGFPQQGPNLCVCLG